MSNRLPPKKMAKKLANLLRNNEPDSIYLKKVFSYVREDLQIMSKRSEGKRLPELLTEQEIKNFYEVVWQESKASHLILVKIFLFTGIRNAEASTLQISDIDLNGLKIHIKRGKGDKDRCVPIPQFFQSELNQYVLNMKEKGNRYLFETKKNQPFSPRWIRKIIRRYAEKAGITKRIYPHLFRHQLLTFLTQKGIIDTKLQQISGHSDRNSLAIYQNISLVDVEEEYQEAMKKFPLNK